MKRPAAGGPAGAGRAAGSGPNQPAGPPQPVQIAVRLMYGGAVLTATAVLLSLLTTHGLRHAIITSTKKHLTAAQITGSEHLIIGSAVFFGLLGIGLWVLMARANGNGAKWARIMSSVLFGINTIDLYIGTTSAHTAPALAFSVAIWLAGLGAIFLLWRPESNAYFS